MRIPVLIVDRLQHEKKGAAPLAGFTPPS